MVACGYRGGGEADTGLAAQGEMLPDAELVATA